MSKYGTPWSASPDTGRFCMVVSDANGVEIWTSKDPAFAFHVVEAVNFCGDADLAKSVIVDRDRLKALEALEAQAQDLEAMRERTTHAVWEREYGHLTRLADGASPVTCPSCESTVYSGEFAPAECNGCQAIICGTCAAKGQWLCDNCREEARDGIDVRARKERTRK